MRTIKPARYLALIAALGLTGGCLYRMPVQQGNMLNRNLVDQLEPGMTRSQVLFLLGTPMVPNGFNTDRWDYFYYFKDDRGNVRISQRLTVWFKDEKVDHFDGDAAPKPKSSTPAATG
jgi:outer membrane protein assembly factor BamE